MIDIAHINKSYGDLKALHDVSLSVAEGEIFGLIGPDGAGKTTLFRILATLMLADDGQVTMLGHDVVRDYTYLRSQLGYMPGRFSLYQDLTVEENLQFFASLFGMTIETGYQLIEPIYRQIEPFKNRRAGKLSGGMKQKLALCCALIHQPKVLLLDEPTTGVDVVSRSEFWDMLAQLKEQGMAILVSTPYMDEASRCDRIALINKGTILDVNTPQRMVESFSVNLYALGGSNMYNMLLHSRKYEHTHSIYSFGDVSHLSVSDSFDREHYRAYMHAAGFTDCTLQPIEPSIEDVFIGLTLNE